MVLLSTFSSINLNKKAQRFSNKKQLQRRILFLLVYYEKAITPKGVSTCKKKPETKPIYNDLISIFVAKNINLVDTFSPVQKSGNYY